MHVIAANAHTFVDGFDVEAANDRHANGHRTLGEFTGLCRQHDVHAVAVLQRQGGVLVRERDAHLQRGRHGHVVRGRIFTDAKTDLKRGLPRFFCVVPELDAPIGSIGSVARVAACGVDVLVLRTVVGHVNRELNGGVLVVTVLLGLDVHTARIVRVGLDGIGVDGAHFDHEVAVSTTVEDEEHLLPVRRNGGEVAAFVTHVEFEFVLHGDHVCREGDTTRGHQHAQRTVVVHRDVPRHVVVKFHGHGRSFADHRGTGRGAAKVVLDQVDGRPRGLQVDVAAKHHGLVQVTAGADAGVKQTDGDGAVVLTGVGFSNDDDPCTGLNLSVPRQGGAVKGGAVHRYRIACQA